MRRRRSVGQRQREGAPQAMGLPLAGCSSLHTHFSFGPESRDLGLRLLPQSHGFRIPRLCGAASHLRLPECPRRRAPGFLPSAPGLPHVTPDLKQPKHRLQGPNCPFGLHSPSRPRASFRSILDGREAARPFVPSNGRRRRKGKGPRPRRAQTPATAAGTH